MSSTTNESGGRKMAKARKDSPVLDESCSDGSLEGRGTLKKGPWTPAEDAILVEYVNKHGEGNWNAVQKHSGLSRCGKSCRLRWANHLRPDLKKGAFTPEEEGLIIELHAKIGNKWARMAAELPGRTDNEIKNFWNTRTKRLQRAGLPIYPPDVCLQVLNGNQESPSMDTLESGDTHCSDLLEDSFEIPDVEFKNLELDGGIYSYMSPLLDIPASSLLRPSVSSSQNVAFMLPTTTLPPKRPRESETLFPCVDGSSISNAYLLGSSPFDPDLIYNHQFPFDGVHGSHALLNGNSSSSEPVSEAMMKSELPSLQYSETQQCSWDSPPSPLHSLESVDTLIQSPPSKQSAQLDRLSHSTGLLEAVIYESQALKRPKNSTSQQTSDNAAMLSDAANSFSAEVKEWKIYGDPNPHSSYSAASEFSEYTQMNQCSSGESQMAETMRGYDVKPEEACQLSAQNADDKELPRMDLSRLDALLDSSWLYGSKHSKDQWILSDAIDALLCEDYISDHP